MTPHRDPHRDPHREDPHTDVGAYVLGVLDPEDRARFERHLAGCPECTAEADGLAGTVPLLAELAGAGPVAVQPSPQLLDRLVGEVSAVRRRARIRRVVLVAAAAVLAVGGPFATLAATGGDGRPPPAAVAVAQFAASDPVTGVSAQVGVEGQPWGSRVGLALSHVTGPQTCDLVAVSRTGERQTVATWSVPATGYGTGALRVTGAAALAPGDIDHFEVRTPADGRVLVSVPAAA